MINNEKIKKNEIAILARFLQSNEKIIQTTSSKQKNQWKTMLPISVILFIMSISLYYSAISKVTVQEWTNTVKKYGSNDYNLGYAYNAIKSQKKTKAILAIVLFISGGTVLYFAIQNATPRNYYLTNNKRIAFKQGMLINNFINLSEIQKIKQVENDKVIITTNLGLEYNLDDCINELINYDYGNQ
jgi:dipeptide/tripeptide permease